jgi:hypothetical protein
MSKSVKIFAMIVLAIAIVVWIGGKFSKSTPPSDEPLSTTADTMPFISTTQSPDNEFSELLSTVTSITIDTSLFASPAYKALRDNPISLGNDIVGRSNPFAPVGADSGDVLAAPIVQTLQPGKVTSTSAEFSSQVTFTTTAPVSVVFQYGTTDQFGSITSPVVLSKSGTVLSTVRDLMPNTTYMVQAVAVVGSTTTNGNTMSFTTTTAPTQ